MSDKAIEIAARLTQYVNDLIEARNMNNELAIRGRTEMISTALSKLRKVHKSGNLSKELIARIQDDKKRAGLTLPDTSSDYLNFCWECYNKRGKHVKVNKRVDSVCRSCGWVQCPVCGACKDPKYGGCKDRVYFNSKNKIAKGIQKELPEEQIPF